MWRDEAIERGLKYLDRVGLLAHKDKYPGHSPAATTARGDRARALDGPDPMLFDEPTSALDPEDDHEVLDVMGSSPRRA